MARSHNISYHDASGKVGELVIAQVAGQSTIKKRSFRNPSQSAAQMQQRATLGSLTQTYKALSKLEKNGWALLGLQMTDPGDGRMRPTLTAVQAFVSVNGTRVAGGLAVVTTAPAAPQPPGLLPPILLTATFSTGSGQFTLTVTAGASGGMVLLYGAGPTLSAQGTPDRSAFRLLGSLGGLSSGANDITALYSAKFRAPEAGEKVSVRLVGVSSGGFRTRPIAANATLVTMALAATGPEPGLTLKAA